MKFILQVKWSVTANDQLQTKLPTDKDLSHWASYANRCALQNLAQTINCKNANAMLVNLKIVSTTESQYLNKKYRGKDKPTNVLSFPFADDLPDFILEQLDECVLGDIALCMDVVNKEAQQQHKSLPAHWAHMMVHSIFHLHGMDHQNQREAAIMETLEIETLAKLGYKNPYQ